VDGAERIGLVTWLVGGSDSSPDEAEIRVVVLDPRRRRRGIGAELLAAAERRLAALAVRRAWLLTTNDNMRALAFYQRLGWRLARLRPGAVDEARLSLKPTLPTVGEHGIPVHDEIVLTRDLGVDR
jgi:ribosomal protein S18 acetylase RimI-like enzyme